MNTHRKASDYERASELLQAQNVRQLEASVQMAIPVVAGFAIAALTHSALGNPAISIGCALGLTAGVVSLPDSFRNRRGSLTTAKGLVAAMWVMAAITTAISLIGLA